MKPYCPNNSNFTFREITCSPCPMPKRRCECNEFKFDDCFNFFMPKPPCNCGNQGMPPHPCNQDFDFGCCHKKIAPCGRNFWTFMFIWCFLERSSNYPTHLTLDQ